MSHVLCTLFDSKREFIKLSNYVCSFYIFHDMIEVVRSLFTTSIHENFKNFTN